MRPRRLLGLLAILLAAVPAPPFDAHSGSGVAGANPLVQTVASTGALARLSFVPSTGGSLLVHGTYPHEDSECVDPADPLLHVRVQGTIEVGRDIDGSLFVIADVPFETYVEGIGEVPRLWPMAALKAQVVAARTYALNRMGSVDPEGTRLGYDICSTTSCQVFRGMAVAGGPYGDRWRAAVAATAGQVLLHRGEPADTLYFSTSNGQTYGNEVVFGGAPAPYLRPVDEPDDGASPLAHWEVRLPFADVARFLRSAGHWSGGAVSSVRRDGSSIVVSGGGRVERLDVLDFRTHLNYWAPCLDPDRYPGQNQGNGLALPQTVPSRWFGTTIEGKAVVLHGRGWGHGVGMVQWGAYGKARRGLGYDDILASYYGGLRPVQHPMPTAIRVAVATGLSSVQIAGTGGVTGSGASVGPGPWLLTGGTRLTVREGGPPPVYIAPGSLQSSPKQASPGTQISADVEVPQLSVAHLALRVNGVDVPIGGPVTVEAGSGSLEGTVPNVPGGLYEVRAVVTNGTDIAKTAPRTLRVLAPTPPPATSGPWTGPGQRPEVVGWTAPSTKPPPSPSPRDPSPTTGPVALAPDADPEGPTALLWAIAAVAGLVMAGALAREAIRERARGRRHTPSDELSGSDPPSSW